MPVFEDYGKSEGFAILDIQFAIATKNRGLIHRDILNSDWTEETDWHGSEGSLTRSIPWRQHRPDILA
jgi:hypothetical protein